jgi:hypothetical protein
MVLRRSVNRVAGMQSKRHGVVVKFDPEAEISELLARLGRLREFR